MQYFVILTLALGNVQSTLNAVLTVPPDATRADIWNHMRQLAADKGRDPRWLDAATTLFFSAEPNTLG